MDYQKQLSGVNFNYIISILQLSSKKRERERERGDLTRVEILYKCHI